MISKSLYVTLLFTFLGISLLPSLNAQQNWTTPEEFRTEYMRFIDALSARVPRSDQSDWAVGLRQKIADIRQQVSALSYPVLDRFSKATERQSFTKMVDQLAAGNGHLDIKDALRAETSTKLVPRVAIVPADFSGAVAGTTCSTSPTSAGTIDGEKIGLYVDRGISLVAEVACETIVEVLGEGTNAPFCIAFGVTKAIEVVLDSLIDHQEFCNGLLDGATAEATLNDVINVHGDVDSLDTHLTNVNNQITNEFTALDTHLTNVDNHITTEFNTLDAHIVTLFATLSTQLSNATDLLKADLKQVMKLELEPEGLRQIVPAILTCDGTAANPCPDVLKMCTGPAGSCAWNRVGPLP